MSLSRTTIPLLKRYILEDSLKLSISAIPRRFAGHSHWQNVRHIKAATDLHKSKTTSRFVRLLEAAVINNGGPDPRFNLALASVIEQAKRSQVVTNAAIETAIKRASDPSAKKSTTSLMYEFFGEHGVLALATVETVNTTRFKHDAKVLCRKHVWGIANGGVKNRFEEKHYVMVNGKRDGQAIDPDELLAVGIEGGAEDMNEIGEGDNRIFEFTCAPGTQFALTKCLQDDYTISDIGKKWLPVVPVEVDEAYAQRVSDFCDALEDHPEVTAVFTNLA